MSIRVTLNGEDRELPEGLSLTALVEHLNLNLKGVGIERNGAMVMRHDWDVTGVEDGDVLELVRFVGGG